MSWEYRIMKHADGSYALHEAYYDRNGKINGWTEKPVVDTHGETLGELENIFHLMQGAFTRPVLSHDGWDDDNVSEEEAK